MFLGVYQLNLQSAGSAVNVAANQTLAAVTQTTTIGGPEALTGLQTLSAVTQSLTIGEVAGLQATQSLQAVSQGANAAAVDTVTAGQSLGTVSQTVTVTQTVPGLTVQAAQPLGTVGQTALVANRVVSSASQTLPAVTQTATIGDTLSVTAGQSLGPVIQTATATMPIAVTAGQTLAQVTQTTALSSQAAVVPITPGIAMPAAGIGGTYAEFERARFANEWYKRGRNDRRRGSAADDRSAARPSDRGPRRNPDVAASADRPDAGARGKAARIAARLHEASEREQRAFIARARLAQDELAARDAETRRQAVIEEQLRLALAAARDDEDAALLLLLA